jgi:hypothetical protein
MGVGIWKIAKHLDVVAPLSGPQATTTTSTQIQRIYKSMTNPEAQLTLDSLSTSFEVGPKRKTLKTSVKRSEGLECAVMKSFDFIQRGNAEGYTAIEFKYADCYFVIAKLKNEVPK